MVMRPPPALRIGLAPHNRAHGLWPARAGAARRLLMTATQHYAARAHDTTRGKSARRPNVNYSLAGCGTPASADTALDDDRDDMPGAPVHVRPLARLRAPRVDASAATATGDDLSPAVARVVAEMRLHMRSGMLDGVLRTFEASGALQRLLPTEAYNLALHAARARDAGTQLQVYEKMQQFGVRADSETHAALVHGLVDAARARQEQTRALAPLLGRETAALASVAAAYAALSPRELVLVCLNILHAALATDAAATDAADTRGPASATSLQAGIDRLIELCAELDVAVSPRVLARASVGTTAHIAFASDAAAAQAAHDAVARESAPSVTAQKTLLRACFAHGDAGRAIAHFDACGAPQRLLPAMLAGFARCGLVGTCRLWAQRTNADAAAVGAALAAIPHDLATGPNENSADGVDDFVGDGADRVSMMPSATALFNRYVALGGGAAGRNAFAELCVAAGDFDRVLLCVREARVSGTQWSASAIAAVVHFLAGREPQLAADVATWQVAGLREQLATSGVRSRVCEELADAAARALGAEGVCDPAVAARLLPIAALTSHTEQLLASVAGAGAVDVETDVAAAGVVAAAALVPAHGDAAVAAAERLHTQHCLYTPEQARAVAENVAALELQLTEEEIDEELSELVRNCARVPSGLDAALGHLERARLLRRSVHAEAVEQLLRTGVRHETGDARVQLLDRVYALAPQTPAVLDSVVRICARAHLGLARTAFDALKARCVPSVGAYAALIDAENDSGRALALVDELLAEHASQVSAHDAAVCALCRHADVAALDAALERLRSQLGLAFGDLHILTIERVLETLAAAGHCERAAALLVGLERDQLDLLSVDAFNCVAGACVHAGDKHRALAMLALRERAGTLGTPHTYALHMRAHLIDAADSPADLAQADGVLAEMKDAGVPATSECFAVLLRARGVQFADLPAAKEFYRGLVKNSRVRPDEKVFSALLDAYKLGSEDTTLVLAEMRRYHVAAPL